LTNSERTAEKQSKVKRCTRFEQESSEGEGRKERESLLARCALDGGKEIKVGKLQSEEYGNLQARQRGEAVRSTAM